MGLRKPKKKRTIGRGRKPSGGNRSGGKGPFRRTARLGPEKVQDEKKESQEAWGRRDSSTESFESSTPARNIAYRQYLYWRLRTRKESGEAVRISS